MRMRGFLRWVPPPPVPPTVPPPPPPPPARARAGGGGSRAQLYRELVGGNLVENGLDPRGVQELAQHGDLLEEDEDSGEEAREEHDDAIALQEHPHERPAHEQQSHPREEG